MFLYVVRHGVSNGNLGLDGSLDSYLAPTGERQAELLGKYLSNVKFDNVLSSPLTRAIQTAAGVATHQPGGNLPIEIFADLVECGTLPGLSERTDEELNAVYPNIVFTENSKTSLGSWGDSHEERDYYLRAESVISYLKNRFDVGSDKNVLVVAHAGFIVKLICAAMGWGYGSGTIFAQRNTCVNLLHFFYDKEGRSRTRLTYSNDVSHLLNSDCPITDP